MTRDGSTAPAGVGARHRLCSEESGLTLIELLVTLTILGLVIGAIAGLLVSAAHTQVDLGNRFQAQQNVVLSLDKLRRELHCASSLTGPGAGIAASHATVVLATQCASGGGTTVTWCTKADPVGSTNQYDLIRQTGAYGASCDPSATGVIWARHLTTANVFTGYTCPTGTSLGFVGVNLPVDTTPADTRQAYNLTDDIVLRNTSRATVVGC